MFLRSVIVILMLLAAGTASAHKVFLGLDFRQYPARVFTQKTTAYPQWFKRQVEIADYVAARIDITIYDYFERANDPKWHFGGHYMLYTTGCGTACQTGVLFDRKTGEVMAQLPSATSGYDFRVKSRLLVVNPTNEEVLRDRDLYTEQATYYYFWDPGRGFKLIHAEDWPPYETVGSLN